MTGKNKTCLLRMTERDLSLFSAKASILGTDKSKLFRDGAFCYWGNKDIDAEDLLQRYKAGTDDEQRIIVDLLFENYRRKGYPYRVLTEHQLQHEMESLSHTKSPVLDDDHLQTNMTGLSLANHFHPHFVKVRCLSRYLSPYECFSDDDRFKDAIRRWLELGNKPTPSGLRRILRTRDGVRSVVNFKPAIAKYIYDTYCPRNGKVLDPCAGYGGRLAGAIGSNKGIHYRGIDPHGPTAIGNMCMADFYSRRYELTGRVWNFGFGFELGCAEDIMPSMPDESFDCILTSPPYHNVERYSDEPTQSYLKFPVYDLWRDGFLSPVIRESFRVLKSGGYFVLNIKNYKHMKIADDACQLSASCGFELQKTYQMRLPNSEFHRHEDEAKYHAEPIFVFKKR